MTSVPGPALDLEAIMARCVPPEGCDCDLCDLCALVAEVRQIRRERDEAGLRWGEHYNTEITRLTAQRDHAREEWHRQNERADRFRFLFKQAKAERDAARAALTRVQALHCECTTGNCACGGGPGWCHGCDESWPCSTARALDVPEPGERLTCRVCGALPLGIHNEEMHAAAEPGEQGGEQ